MRLGLLGIVFFWPLEKVECPFLLGAEGSNRLSIWFSATGMVGIRGEPELPGLFGTDMVFAHDIGHRVQAATTAPLSQGRENMRTSVTPFGLGVNGFDFHQKRIPSKGSRARDELGPFVKAGGRHPQ